MTENINNLPGEKPMKKTRVLILCLLAALVCILLAGCGSKEKNDVSGSQYVGTWNAVSLPKFTWRSSKAFIQAKKNLIL